MEIPEYLKGDQLVRLLQAAALGAGVTAFAGFYWGGWVTGGGAQAMAQKSATEAKVAALGPVCADNFKRSAQASDNFAELKKAAYQWDRSKIIEKGGWATAPGGSTPDSAVATACAELLGAIK